MKFCLRVDDYGWTTDPHPQMAPPAKEWDVGLRMAKRFHEALGGLPYLAAVIPMGLDDIGWEWLKGARAHDGLEPALHGFSHQHGEFEGLDLDAARQRLELGNGLMRAQHYVPPFNAFDVTDRQFTEALWHEGIRYVWGAPRSWDTPPSPFELTRGVKFIPAWQMMYAATRWEQAPGTPPLLAVLAGNWWHDTPGNAVITLHLPWEFARDPQLAGVRLLADMIRGHVVSPSEFVACA